MLSTDAGHGEPLELGHDRGLRVLGDHVAGVHAGIVRQERRQPVAAGLVEEPVGPSFRHARDVRDGDRQEVEHVPDRRAVEVAVGLHAAVLGDDGVVDRRRELSFARPAWRARACPARRRRPAARSGGCTRPARACPPGRGGSPRSGCPQGCGGCCSRRAAARAAGGARGGRASNTRSVPSRPSTLIAAVMSAVVSRFLEVRDREDEHAEHPVRAVDQREPFLLVQRDRVDHVLRVAQLVVRVAHLPLPHQRQRTVGERREVPGAPERAVLVHDRREVLVQQPRVGVRGLGPHAGAAGRKRGEPQQHQRPDGLALDLVAAARGVAADQATSAGRCASAAGCAAWRERRSRC